MSHEIEPCPVCGMKAHVEYIHKLERELHEANERARVAEANDEASRVASATEWLIVQDKEREISRLTAEVEEWKKKATAFVEWYDKYCAYLTGGGLGTLAKLIRDIRSCRNQERDNG